MLREVLEGRNLYLPASLHPILRTAWNLHLSVSWRLSILVKYHNSNNEGSKTRRVRNEFENALRVGQRPFAFIRKYRKPTRNFLPPSSQTAESFTYSTAQNSSKNCQCRLCFLASPNLRPSLGGGRRIKWKWTGFTRDADFEELRYP